MSTYNRLNFKRYCSDYSPDGGLFKRKFGRLPKFWTIEMVHDLYLKATDRHNKRLKLWIDCVDRIANEVQEFEKNKRIIYFTRDGKIYQRVLSKYSEYDSWGVQCADLVKFSTDSTLLNRNEKLEFLLSNEKAFELGELYESIDGLTKHLHLFVKQILSDMINEKLVDKLKNMTSPEILTVSIGEKKYYVKCDDQYRRNRIYKKFELLNEVTDEIEL